MKIFGCKKLQTHKTELHIIFIITPYYGNSVIKSARNIVRGLYPTLDFFWLTPNCWNVHVIHYTYVVQRSLRAVDRAFRPE